MACNVIWIYRRFRETFSFLIQDRSWSLCICVKHPQTSNSSHGVTSEITITFKLGSFYYIRRCFKLTVKNSDSFKESITGWDVVQSCCGLRNSLWIEPKYWSSILDSDEEENTALSGLIKTGYLPCRNVRSLWTASNILWRVNFSSKEMSVKSLLY